MSTRWEYLVMLEYRARNAGDSSKHVLYTQDGEQTVDSAVFPDTVFALGAEGWELVSSTPLWTRSTNWWEQTNRNGSSSSVETVRSVFKRPAGEGVPQ